MLTPPNSACQAAIKHRCATPSVLMGSGDARPRAGTDGHVSTGNDRFLSSRSGRACPPMPELTYPFCTHALPLSRGLLVGVARVPARQERRVARRRRRASTFARARRPVDRSPVRASRPSRSASSFSSPGDAAGARLVQSLGRPCGRLGSREPSVRTICGTRSSPSSSRRARRSSRSSARRGTRRR